ncbi:MAG: hypothetical protein ACOVLB_02750 [Candidatus Nanopelagicus sp.]
MLKDTRVNGNNKGPEYHPGQQVYHGATRKYAQVVKQVLLYDGLKDYWGNVIVIFENDSVEAQVHCWQLSRVIL